MWSGGLILFLVSTRWVYIMKKKKNNVLLLKQTYFQVTKFSCRFKNLQNFLENLESWKKYNINMRIICDI